MVALYIINMNKFVHENLRYQYITVITQLKNVAVQILRLNTVTVNIIQLNTVSVKLLHLNRFTV